MEEYRSRIGRVECNLLNVYEILGYYDEDKISIDEINAAFRIARNNAKKEERFNLELKLRNSYGKFGSRLKARSDV